jgi:hypothetical protein
MTEAEWLACTDPMPMLAFLRGRASARKLRLFACACACRACDLLAPLEPYYDVASLRADLELSERFADGQAPPEELFAASVVPKSDWLPARDWPEDPSRRAYCFLRSAVKGAVSVYCEAYVLEGRPLPPEAGPERAAQDAINARRSDAERRAMDCREEEDRTPSPPDPAEECADERGAQAEMLRCVFGNPFRAPRPLPAEVSGWNGGTVGRLAAAIYADRTFRPPPPLPLEALSWCEDIVRRLATSIYARRAVGWLPILADALLDAGCDNEDLIQHCREPGPHVRGCWAVDLILGKG